MNTSNGVAVTGDVSEAADGSINARKWAE